MAEQARKVFNFDYIKFCITDETSIIRNVSYYILPGHGENRLTDRGTLPDHLKKGVVVSYTPNCKKNVSIGNVRSIFLPGRGEKS